MNSISELWMSTSPRDWTLALECYWNVPSVKRNLEIEKYMGGLNPEVIKRLDRDEWYAFLDKYFRWKFTDPRYTQKRLDDLARNSIETLYTIKEKLFSFGLSDISRGLEVTTSRKGIKGLGPAGASGLLAVLFPKWFGTADQFVVKGLSQIESVPERNEILGMIKLDRKNKESVQLREKDALLLIKIMRRKAIELNTTFGTVDWTPRKVDMVLFAVRDEVAARSCG